MTYRLQALEVKNDNSLVLFSVASVAKKKKGMASFFTNFDFNRKQNTRKPQEKPLPNKYKYFHNNLLNLNACF